ncbi:MAG: hypothetical protein ABI852_19260 [Gemmatimonadaceae bacterium]
MNFFSNLLGRSVKPLSTPVDPTNADPFAGQGFIYHETLTSPDGTILVHNGYSGGEKGPTIVEPKVVVAATGRVLFDLWKTYQHHSIVFTDAASHAEMRVHNTHNGGERIVDIDFSNETFSFKENPAARHTLAKLPDMISMF